jgi:hypothetical protein
MKNEQAVRLISKINKDTQEGFLKWMLWSDEPSAEFPAAGPIFSAKSKDQSLTFFLYEAKRNRALSTVDAYLAGLLVSTTLVVEDTASKTKEALSGFSVLGDLYQAVRETCFPLDRSVRQYLSAE